MQVQQQATIKPSERASEGAASRANCASNSELKLITLAPRGKKAKRARVEYEFSGIAG